MNTLLSLIESRLQLTPDPLQVRKSTAAVIVNSSLVTINLNKLELLTKQLGKALGKKRLLTSDQFGSQQVSPQKIFLLDSVNFCFWTAKDKPLWQVEYPKGTITSGWKALVSCFDRALKEKYPILDSQFMQKLTLKQARHIFRGLDNTVIPLLEKRLDFLKKAGAILSRRFSGQIDKLILKANADAVNIAQLVIDHFPYFKDEGICQNRPVKFYKRAQIVAYDLSLLSNQHISNLDQLTIFADYRLPQFLRFHKVLKYQDSLARKIDNQELIDKGSQAELAIRAATVWTGELLAQKLNTSPAVVDNAMWSLNSLNPPDQPHHRTITTSY